MGLVLKRGEFLEQQNRVFGGDKGGDEVRKLRQGHSWAYLGARPQGPKERLEKGYCLIFVKRPTCSRSCGVSWRGRLCPDGELSLDLTPRPQACKAACKWEGNMIRFVF